MDLLPSCRGRTGLIVLAWNALRSRMVLTSVTDILKGPGNTEVIGKELWAL